MIALKIWLRHDADLNQLGWMRSYVQRSRCGRPFIHITHPHCSPLVHELPKELVREVELHDYSIDEQAIANGARTHKNVLLYALSAEAEWMDGRMHLIQHIVARGPNIRDVM